MPECLQQYLRSLFCRDITNFNATNSEMFGVNTFVDFLFSSIGEKINKRLRGSIRFPLYKFLQTRNTLQTARDILTELGMIPKDTLSQKHSLHLEGELILPEI